MVYWLQKMNEEQIKSQLLTFSDVSVSPGVAKPVLSSYNAKKYPDTHHSLDRLNTINKCPSKKSCSVRKIKVHYNALISPIQLAKLTTGEDVISIVITRIMYRWQHDGEKDFISLFISLHRLYFAKLIYFHTILSE